METDHVVIYELPQLHRPHLVMALAGWADAAQVATKAIAYLIKKLDAIRFAEIKPGEFYDFSSLRPAVTIDRGLITSLKLPP